MIRFLCFLFIFFFCACGDTSPSKSASVGDTSVSETDSFTAVKSPPTVDTVSLPGDEMYTEYYVVITDTGTDYSVLHRKMISLHQSSQIPVDTLGRTWNPKKKIIALPENSDDEIYAGEYFPRRFPSENLSLEYLSYYSHPAGDSTMALVAGICEEEKGADSLVSVLAKKGQPAFKVKARIYTGCMH